MKRQVTILVITSQIILYYSTLSLIYDSISSFRLYYIQFKEVKPIWEPRAGGGMLEPGARGQITQTSGRWCFLYWERIQLTFFFWWFYQDFLFQRLEIRIYLVIILYYITYFLTILHLKIKKSKKYRKPTENQLVLSPEN